MSELEEMSIEQIVEDIEYYYNEMQIALYRTVTGSRSRRYLDAANKFDALVNEYCKRENCEGRDFSKPENEFL